MITNPSSVKVTQPNAVKVALFFVCLYAVGQTTAVVETAVAKPAPDADGRFTLPLSAVLAMAGPPHRNVALSLAVYGASPTGRKSASVYATDTLVIGAIPPVDDTPDPPALVELQA